MGLTAYLAFLHWGHFGVFVKNVLRRKASRDSACRKAGIPAEVCNNFYVLKDKIPFIKCSK